MLKLLWPPVVCKEMYGDALASWLVLLSPEQAVQVQAVAGDKVLCSWARHLRTFAPKISHVQIF